MMSPPQIKYSSAVLTALQTHRPVVALESTIISHGMPYPENYETAKAVESIVRDNGAEPATCAILDGIIHVGLDDGDLEKLAKLGPKVSKTSRRDIARVIAAKGNGATTVSGTMVIAHMAGITVFVTGGIGGVHRGAETTMDISADLVELGRTPMCVVCGGVKSILDIPKTLEYLETQGVSVLSYGTKEFPAFFTAQSGVPSPGYVNTPEEAAAIVSASTSLSLVNSTLVAVPIPSHLAADGLMVEKAIKQALQECSNQGIIGAAVTPFLLKRVNELTQGKSLESNIALIKNNAKIGASIASALSHFKNASLLSNIHGLPLDVVVLGAAILDVVCKPKEPKLVITESNIGSVEEHVGGVGRNVAETVGRLGNIKVALVAAVGEDSAAAAIVNVLDQASVRTDLLIRVGNERSAKYVAMQQGDGDLFVAVNDTCITRHVTPAVVSSLKPVIQSSKIVVLDGNLDEVTMIAAAKIAVETNRTLWFEPTSAVKSQRIITSGSLPYVSYVSPNLAELAAMCCALGMKCEPANPNNRQGIERQARHLIAVGGIKGGVVAHAGATGVIFINATTTLYKPALPVSAIQSTNGAGDSFTGGCVWGLAKGMAISAAMDVGLICAKASVECLEAVNPSLQKYLKQRASL